MPMRTISKFGSGTSTASSETGGVRSRCPVITVTSWPRC